MLFTWGVYIIVIGNDGLVLGLTDVWLLVVFNFRSYAPSPCFLVFKDRDFWVLLSNAWALLMFNMSLGTFCTVVWFNALGTFLIILSLYLFLGLPNESSLLWGPRLVLACACFLADFWYSFLLKLEIDFLYMLVLGWMLSFLGAWGINCWLKVPYAMLSIGYCIGTPYAVCYCNLCFSIAPSVSGYWLMRFLPSGY